MKIALALFFLVFSSGFIAAQENTRAISLEKGEKLYKKKCAICHSKKGTGKGKRIPPLAQSDYLMSNRVESLRAVKYGLEGEIIVNGVVYDNAMNPIELSDQEIADVMNYVLNSWGNRSDDMVTADEVSSIFSN